MKTQFVIFIINLLLQVQDLYLKNPFTIYAWWISRRLLQSKLLLSKLKNFIWNWDLIFPYNVGSPVYIFYLPNFLELPAIISFCVFLPKLSSQHLKHKTSQNQNQRIIQTNHNFLLHYADKQKEFKTQFNHNSRFLIFKSYAQQRKK